ADRHRRSHAQGRGLADASRSAGGRQHRDQALRQVDMSNELTGQRARAVSGVLGTKLGMTQVWDEGGKLVPVTVVQAGPNVVTQVRSVETDGYDSVQIAYGQIDPRKVSRPLRGHFEKAGVTPRRHLAELRTSDATDFTPGQEIDASIFEAGQKVDVVGTSKGKGTAGAMKRHNFAGVSA